MKLLALFGWAVLGSQLLLSVRSDDDIDPDTLFSAVTTEEDWDYCELEYSENCPPTISIEEASCEAPLIVFGRVIDVVEDDGLADSGSVQISVHYKNYRISEQPEGIPKWGAGIENTVEGSVFFNNSGVFKTWVHGFNNTLSSIGTTACGTVSPQVQVEYYFLLDALPEFEGVVPAIADNEDLNINFTLSTTILESGYADGTRDIWRFVESGALTGDHQFMDNCRAIYCCYNPDCGECENMLDEEPPNFEPGSGVTYRSLCRVTYAPDDSTPAPTVTPAPTATPAPTPGATPDDDHFVPDDDAAGIHKSGFGTLLGLLAMAAFYL